MYTNGFLKQGLWNSDRVGMLRRWLISAYWAGGIHNVDMLDKGTVPILSGTEWDGTRFYDAIQNGMKLKT